MPVTRTADAPAAPVVGAGLTAAELDALYCYGKLKAGYHRNRELQARNVAPATVDAMVARGYLKRVRGGATQIKPLGRQALVNRAWQ